jgi:hypothetical protein
MRFSVISNPIFNIDKIVFELKNTTATNELNNEQPFFIVQNKSNEIIVSYKSNQQLQQIRLYSITGSLLKMIKNPGSQTVIPTHDLPLGIYIVQGSNSTKRFSEKIVIHNF